MFPKNVSESEIRDLLARANGKGRACRSIRWHCRKWLRRYAAKVEVSPVYKISATKISQQDGCYAV